MKLAVLFSGGKDSTYALFKAMQKEEVACLISVISENAESYMFHTPNISLVELQAQAVGLPLIKKATKGEKERELADLKDAISEAKETYGIEGVVTGAVESVYQASRIQKICLELNVRCFNPLWQKDQMEIVKEVVELGFDVMISGVFAYPFSKHWLGERLRPLLIDRLKVYQEKYMISPSGEGGEIETTVLDAPFFKKKIVINDYDTEYDGYAGTMIVKEAGLEDKEKTEEIKPPVKRLIGENLIIDMNEKKDSLHHDEFVLPIAKVLGYNCFVRHYKDVDDADIKKCKRIIMSGSALSDISTTNDENLFSWLKTTDKPVLGICAGLHTIADIFGSGIKKMDEAELGMKEIKVKKNNELIPKDIQAYNLHKYRIEPVKGFDVLAVSDRSIQAIKHKEKRIYGLQFHPEVRNHSIIERFLEVHSH